MPADSQLSQAIIDNPIEIVICRTFNSPRELVWQAWTDEKHVGNWWGPAGFTTTTHSMDFREGGAWRYTMHGPDRTDYPCHIDYIEIDHPSQLIYRLGGEGENNSETSFRTKVTFEQLADGQQTKVTMRSTFPTAEARDFVINNYGAVEGGKQHLANLEDYLAGMSNRDDSEPPFTISHVFNAPRETVWQAWTQRDHLMKWFGPKGSSMTHGSLDLRVGCKFHYCMSHPGGMELWGHWIFRTIDHPNTLVFASSFSNAESEIVAAPFQGLEDFPPEVLTTVTFASHAGIGKGTLVTIEARPLTGSTQAQRDFFAGFHNSMRDGWTGTMAQLAEFLGS